MSRVEEQMQRDAEQEMHYHYAYMEWMEEQKQLSQKKILKEKSEVSDLKNSEMESKPEGSLAASSLIVPEPTLNQANDPLAIQNTSKGEQKMKTTRYQFETTVQSATEQNIQWLKEQYKAILESGKDYTRKADYIGLSLLSIDERIVSIDEELKELQSLKKSLKTAKELVLQTGAKVFKEYGIDKIDGAVISSITVTPSSTSERTRLVIEDPDALIEGGLYKKVVDEQKVREYYTDDRYALLIQKAARLEVVSTPKPSKLKINKRRTKATNTETFASIGEVI